MENISIEITDDDILILKVNLKKEIGLTNRGSSVRIASSAGNVGIWKNNEPLPDNVRFNLNVFRNLRDNEEKRAAAYRKKGIWALL